MFELSAYNNVFHFLFEVFWTDFGYLRISIIACANGMPLIYAICGLAKMYEWSNLTTLWSYQAAASFVALGLRELNRPRLNETIVSGADTFQERLFELANSNQEDSVKIREILLLNAEFDTFIEETVEDPGLS